MIVQSVSAAGITDISFTTLSDELPKIESHLGPIVQEIAAKGFTAQGGIAKLSVVGDRHAIPFRCRREDV
jgi:hypothetical protein